MPLYYSNLNLAVNHYFGLLILYRRETQSDENIE